MTHYKIMRLAFISSHPAPYRDVFLGFLSKSRCLDVTIFTEFMDDKWHLFWDLSKPPYPLNLIVKQNETHLKVFYKILKTFVFGSYDCVCWNGFPPRLYMLIPLFLAALFKKNYGIYADSITEKSGPVLWRLFKKFIVSRSSFMFVPGRASLEFFTKSYCVPSSRICVGAYSLDGKSLEADILRLRSRRVDIRKSLHICQGDSVFLMVANMLPKRQYPITTSAFLKVAETHSNIKYVIVGVGDDLEAMQRLSLEHAELLVIPGCSFEKMLEFYAMADIYVHGGYEPASTALVLGGIAHLPIISSYAVGCSKDILEDGVSGMLVNDHNSESDWIDAFERILDSRMSWQKMGERARRLSMNLDVDETVARFENIVKKTFS